MGQRTKKKVSLKDNDWKELFPGEEFKIGSTSLILEPLSLKGLSFVIDKISRISESISKLEISFSDLKGSDFIKLTGLVHLIVLEAPEILAEMSGLESDDIKEIPLDKAVELFIKCLDINILSQESLIKNFKELGVKIEKFAGIESSPQMNLDSEV